MLWRWENSLALARIRTPDCGDCSLVITPTAPLGLPYTQGDMGYKHSDITWYNDIRWQQCSISGMATLHQVWVSVASPQQNRFPWITHTVEVTIHSWYLLPPKSKNSGPHYGRIYARVTCTCRTTTVTTRYDRRTNRSHSAWRVHLILTQRDNSLSVWNQNVHLRQHKSLPFGRTWATPHPRNLLQGAVIKQCRPDQSSTWCGHLRIIFVCAQATWFRIHTMQSEQVNVYIICIIITVYVYISCAMKIYW